MTLMQRLKDLHCDEDGASATEYIILIILIACVVIAVVKLFGTTVSTKYHDANELVEKKVKMPT